ncbi:Hypothetical protein Minf_1677 [Methylacidiphilum infernorum V4]|uniref:Uncharacterized protein n=1 Tax=Methylacidiphilum infernorum (isolate V4) TaxID=481448 RepID=B3DWR8_METI4|nr:Hypothetical protein Minf_1677 [Methylacidiphilum infernorum V4]
MRLFFLAPPYLVEGKAGKPAIYFIFKRNPPFFSVLGPG